MATEADLPNIIITGFFSTFESRPKRNEFGEFILAEGGKREMENLQIDWVTYSPRASALSMSNSERIIDMDPERLIRKFKLRGNLDDDQIGLRVAFFRARWEMIEPAYRAWKNNEELPIKGTPLQLWPLLRREHVAALLPFGIKTVEDVASMPTAVEQRIKLPNVGELRAQAKAFIANQATAANAKKNAERDAKFEEMEKTLSGMGEFLASINPKGLPLDQLAASILAAQAPAKTK